MAGSGVLAREWSVLLKSRSCAPNRRYSFRRVESGLTTQDAVIPTDSTTNVGDSSLCDDDRALLAELFEDGKHLLGPYAKGLVEFTAGYEDVGDLALGDGA